MDPDISPYRCYRKPVKDGKMGDAPSAASGGGTLPDTWLVGHRPTDAISTDPVAGNTTSVGFLLFSAYRGMETRVMRRLAQAGYGDVTAAQARLFRRIAPQGSRLTELADAVFVTKQTAGFLVDHLTRAGYVRRVADPADARARLVMIAPKGAAVVPIAAEVIADVETEWAALLGTDRLERLRDTLQALRELTGEFR
jgi:DNA-binding MarR family transcriptional regulator